MIEKFEAEARRIIQWKEDAEKNRLEREEQDRLEKLREMKQAQELSSTKALLQRALRWEKSVIMRRYIDELHARATQNDTPLPQEMAQYLDWAVKKADWYDPFINAEDEYLTDKDRELVEQPDQKTSRLGFVGYGYTEPTDYFPGKSWYHK